MQHLPSPILEQALKDRNWRDIQVFTHIGMECRGRSLPRQLLITKISKRLRVSEKTIIRSLFALTERHWIWEPRPGMIRANGWRRICMRIEGHKSKARTSIDPHKIHDLNYLKALCFSSGIKLLIRRRQAKSDRPRPRSRKEFGHDFTSAIFKRCYNLSRGSVTKLKKLASANGLLRIEPHYHELYGLSGREAIKLRNGLAKSGEGGNICIHADGSGVIRMPDLFFVL